MTRWRHLIRSEGGFIPMLLALLIAAGGVIGLGAILLRGGALGLQNSKSSIEQLAHLEKAIRAQVFRSGVLPCPAHGDGDGAAKPGCTANNNDGVVPWTTLGITKDDATDPFGRLISYHVDPDLVAGNICTGVTARPGTLRLNPSTNTSLFVLISHGPNGLGGWLPIGQQMGVPASTLERENCSDSVSNATIVRCSNPDAKDVIQGPHQTDPAKASYFDDITLAARSADYDAVCASAESGGPPGAQVSFGDISGTAPPGVEGELGGGDPFIGTRGKDAPSVTVGEGIDATLVKIGVRTGGGVSASSACIFLKDLLALRVAGTDRVLRNYLEVAFRADETTDGSRGEGVVLAFVPTKRDSGPPRYNDSLPICGGDGENLGFQSGASSNFPDSNKFGVEIDTRSNAAGSRSSIADPVNNHLAIDRNRVEHQNSAGPKCVAGVPGSLSEPPTGCFAHPGNRDWLEAGQTAFHQLRVEVHAGGAAKLPGECAAGEAAILAWLFESTAQCTDNCNDLRTNYTNSGRQPAAFVKHCLSVPHDDVRIGLTTGYDRLSSEPVLRNFGTGSYSSP